MFVFYRSLFCKYTWRCAQASRNLCFGKTDPILKDSLRRFRSLMHGRSCSVPTTISPPAFSVLPFGYCTRFTGGFFVAAADDATLVLRF